MLSVVLKLSKVHFDRENAVVFGDAGEITST